VAITMRDLERCDGVPYRRRWVKPSTRIDRYQDRNRSSTHGAKRRGPVYRHRDNRYFPKRQPIFIPDLEAVRHEDTTALALESTRGPRAAPNPADCVGLMPQPAHMGTPLAKPSDPRFVGILGAQRVLRSAHSLRAWSHRQKCATPKPYGCLAAHRLLRDFAT